MLTGVRLRSSETCWGLGYVVWWEGDFLQNVMSENDWCQSQKENEMRWEGVRWAQKE
jgi:hypothetical protein